MTLLSISDQQKKACPHWKGKLKLPHANVHWTPNSFTYLESPIKFLIGALIRSAPPFPLGPKEICV